MTTNYIEKIKGFLSEDPKPIFDHVRNIGIAAAIIISGGLLKTNKLSANIESPEIINFAAFSLAIGGTTLFIINMIFAQKKISALILGKHASIGVLARLSLAKRLIKARKRINKKILTSISFFYAKDFLAQIVVVAYYIFILSLVFAQALSSHNGPSLNDAPPKNELYINIEKVNSTIHEIVKRNKVLEAELKELKVQLNAKDSMVVDLEKSLEAAKIEKNMHNKKQTHAR